MSTNDFYCLKGPISCQAATHLDYPLKLHLLPDWQLQHSHHLNIWKVHWLQASHSFILVPAQFYSIFLLIASHASLSNLLPLLPQFGHLHSFDSIWISEVLLGEPHQISSVTVLIRGWANCGRRLWRCEISRDVAVRHRAHTDSNRTPSASDSTNDT